MAFIKTEEVKNIRNQLKKEFQNIKFSVTRLNYSKVKIVLLSGDWKRAYQLKEKAA